MRFLRALALSCLALVAASCADNPLQPTLLEPESPESSLIVPGLVCQKTTIAIGEQVLCWPNDGQFIYLWASSNPSVATVQSGVVTGIAAGSADISAHFWDQRYGWLRYVRRITVQNQSAPACSAPGIVGPTGGMLVGPAAFNLTYTLPPHTCRQIGELRVVDQATGQVVYSDHHEQGMAWRVTATGPNDVYRFRDLAWAVSGRSYEWQVRSRQADPFNPSATLQWSPWSASGAFQYTTLGVQLSGPNSIGSTGVYTWSAQASGGSGSYTYQWYRKIDHQTWTCHFETPWEPVGTGQSYSSHVSGRDYDFRLMVTVTSGGESRSTQMKVFQNIDHSGAICPE
jgi:hypothetical protein